MQYLKVNVRENITKSALNEFMEKGYQGASIRGIAKQANTSVGNIYKYFKSKEDIYENIIGSVYHRLIDYISKFDKIELNEDALDVFNNLMEKIMRIFNESNKEISTLLNQSKGSKYEDCKEIFVDFITRTVTDAMEYELSKEGKKLRDNYIIYLLSNSLMESIAIIVKEKQDGKEVRRIILKMIDIFYSNVIDKLDVEEIS